jgi:hypothetical protein
MADTKISALTGATTPLAGTEVAPIVQSGTTVKATVEAIATSTQPSGTANGVQYLNGSKVPTTGSILTFNGTGLGVGVSTATDPQGFGRSIDLVSATYGGVYYARSSNSADTYGFFGYDYSSLTAQITAYGTNTSLNLNTGTGATATKIAIDSAGDVNVKVGNLVQGTAAKGINFTANTPAAGMTSQLLNWYEEGTWTPVLTDGTNDATMDSTTGGTYTRIGNRVCLSARVATTSLGSVTGNMYIKGLPFACVGFTGNYASYGNHAAGGGSGLNITAGQSVSLQPDPGNTRLLVKIWNSATGSANMTTTEWSADGEVNFQIFYACA